MLLVDSLLLRIKFNKGNDVLTYALILRQMNLKKYLLIIVLGTFQFLNAQDGGSIKQTCFLKSDVFEANSILVKTMDSLGLSGRFVPTCFGDASFGFYSNCLLEEYSLIIFNRWGEIVFETSVLNDSWKTADAKNGTYTFKVTTNILENPYVGHFDVVN